jgi:hypothetical protein
MRAILGKIRISLTFEWRISIYGQWLYKNESAGTRTQDLRLKRPLLYQLSYTPAISELPCVEQFRNGKFFLSF